MGRPNAVARIAARWGLPAGVLIAGAVTATVGLASASAVMVVAGQNSAGARTGVSAAPLSPTTPTVAPNLPFSPSGAAEPDVATLPTAVSSGSGSGAATRSNTAPLAAQPTASPGTTVETLPADAQSTARALLNTTPPGNSLETPVLVEAQASGQASPTGASQVSVQAQAAVQTNASATWAISYGDGSAPATLTIPPASCGPARNRLVATTGITPHVFAAPGTYSIVVSIGLTTCTGAPGPSAMTTFSYEYISDGGVPGGNFDNWAPAPGYVVPAGDATTGTVWMPPTASHPDGVATTLYAYCQSPSSVAPGAVFTITCTVVTPDPSTPITVSCPLAACTVPGTPVTPVAGTAFGAPAALATVSIPESMPTGASEVTWYFSIHQGTASFPIAHGVTAASA